MKKVIGIDLGGTAINCGLINEKGEILKKASKETGAKDGRDLVLSRITDTIKELIQGEKIEGIGIGSPGFIDVKEGKVLSIGSNIEGWAHTNIKEEISKEFIDIPVFVENDANLAAICEEWLGSVQGFDSFIMLTLGTGVGGGIYSKEEAMWHGAHYEGAELGHAILYPNGRECNCGQKGCVEKYISGNAIEENYKTLTGKNLSGEEIFKNSKSDENCRDVIGLFVEDLGNFLITIKNIFDPQAVVIGGGVINSREFWWDDVLKYYEENCNSMGMKIIPAKFLNDAGMIGAAKLIFDKI